MTSQSRGRFRGFILLTVLWISLGMLLAAASYLATQRQTALSTRAEVETGRAVELARSGLNVALADLGRYEPDQARSLRDGTPVTITMAEGQVTYRIFDEGGKLDINQAPVQLLAPTLQQLGEGQGIDAFDAVTIARAIITQRGDEGERGNFRSIALLLTELGFPQEASLEARRVLTTYNIDAQINPITAPPPLLAAIPGLGPSDVSTIVERRSQGLSMPRLGTASVWLGGTEGPVYTVQAEGLLTSGVRAQVIATVAIQGLSFRGGRTEYDFLGMEILR
ncbi:general secretion pathway protein GspK [Loktanella sp. Alg231-35]|uniref:general secretion pathway protein GspK n=1 Tax=Loktanella sp. Alg231-35 TaxID=1922220 RepID=UPI00131F174E|nr:type II secretion system protein GspK [Loktanella sp. Alg231-35]